MEMSAIIEYIKPEMLVLIPVLYIIGTALKGTTIVANKYIPLVLGGIGTALAMLWVFATCAFDGWQCIVTGLFTAITQGILCAGGAVYINQTIKQAKKDE